MRQAVDADQMLADGGISALGEPQDEPQDRVGVFELDCGSWCDSVGDLVTQLQGVVETLDRQSRIAILPAPGEPNVRQRRF